MLVSLWGSPSAAASKRVDTGLILFFPYGTATCTLLHRLVGEDLKRAGYNFKVLPPIAPSQETAQWRDPDNGSAGVEFETFSALISAIKQATSDDDLISVGAIDEFLRFAPLSSFTTRHVLPDSFLIYVREISDLVYEQVKGADAIFIGDRAYLHNAARLSAAKRLGIPCWELNPEGRFAPVNFQEIGKPRVQLDSLDRFISEGSLNKRRAENYFVRRLGGKSHSDHDSRRVFDDSQKSRATGDKKVLFLHVFRDANQIPERAQEEGINLFSSFFEWTDRALQLVAEDPESWIVKPHPTAVDYPDEPQILEHLMKKHGLSSEKLVKDVATSSVLASQAPIYTHSGTVALEAAALGRKAYSVGFAFPAEIAERAQSISDMEEQFRLPVNCRPPNVDSKGRLRAKVALFQEFAEGYSTLGVRRPHPRKSSTVLYQWDLLMQQLDFVRIMATPRARAKLRWLTAQVLSTLGSGAPGSCRQKTG